MSTYIYDNTGVLPANRILNESHTISAGNGVDSQLILPIFGPFFGTSMVIVDASGNALNPNVDYFLTHHWAQASDASGHEVYGTVTLLPSALGEFKLTYQTLGGDWVDTKANTVVSGLANLTVVLAADWSTAPTAFPVTQHVHTLSGLTGMTDILDAFDRVILALNNPHTTVAMNNITDFDVNFVNPLLSKMDTLVTVMGNRPTKVINYDVQFGAVSSSLDALITEVLANTDGITSVSDRVTLLEQGATVSALALRVTALEDDPTLPNLVLAYDANVISVDGRISALESGAGAVNVNDVFRLSSMLL